MCTATCTWFTTFQRSWFPCVTQQKLFCHLSSAWWHLATGGAIMWKQGVFLWFPLDLWPKRKQHRLLERGGSGPMRFQNTIKFHVAPLLAEPFPKFAAVFLCSQFTHTKGNKLTRASVSFWSVSYQMSQNPCWLLDFGRALCHTKAGGTWMHVGRWCNNLDKWRISR